MPEFPAEKAAKRAPIESSGSPSSDELPSGSPSSGESSSVSKMHPTVKALGWVSLFSDLASKMVYPITPFFLTVVLGAPAWTVGVIEGIAESTAGLLKLYSGWLSDRAGQRKPFAVAGYGLGAMSKLGLAIASSWGTVLGARLLDRVGKGLRAAPRDALIADNCAPEQRGQAYGLHHSLETIGEVVGPLLGFAFLWQFANNYRGVFGLAFVPALIGVFVLLKGVKEKSVKENDNNETHKASGNRAAPKFTFRRLSPTYQRYLGIITLFGLGNSSDAFLLLRAQDLGASGLELMLLYASFNLVSVALAITIGRASDRVGRRPLLMAGYGLFSLVYLGFAIAYSSALVWILFLFYGLYGALTRGVQKALVADLVHPQRKGAEIGTFHMLSGLVALPASLFAGFLYTNVSAGAPFYFSAGMGVIATGLLWQLRLPQVSGKTTSNAKN
ncbi:MAG: MFS transporter [Cyanobacteria bacterium P01_D01_bin.105]